MFITFMRTSKWVPGLLFIVRLYLGYTWISAGIKKLTGGFDASGFLKGAIGKSTGDNPIVKSWWAAFLEHVALPNADLFSFLVQWGELSVGTGLILGALTKSAAFFGLVMNLAFLLSGSISTNPILFILSTILLISGTSAGRIGLDYYLFSRWTRKPKEIDPALTISSSSRNTTSA